MSFPDIEGHLNASRAWVQIRGLLILYGKTLSFIAINCMTVIASVTQ
jgi:hypothetical protein